MIGQPKTRTEFQHETGLKGKALTTYLKTLVQGGVVIKRLAYAEPSKSARRHAVYQSIPASMELPFSEAQ